MALDIIHLVSPLKFSDALAIIRKQLIRSATSVAANFRAVCRARSEKDRYAKLCIVVEEADETLFWIEMMIEAGFISIEQFQAIVNEGFEILKVMSAFKKRVETKI